MRPVIVVYSGWKVGRGGFNVCTFISTKPVRSGRIDG